MKEIDIIYASPGMSFIEIPEFAPSIFLAGPTPRNQQIPSWRPVALHILAQVGFEGQIFVPEVPSGGIEMDYREQIEWEETYLMDAKCIMFWIPRDLRYLPGFTTNIEFGRWCNVTNKVVVGWPPESPKMKYISYYTDKLGIPTASTLEKTIELAVEVARKNTKSRECLEKTAEFAMEIFGESGAAWDDVKRFGYK